MTRAKMYYLIGEKAKLLGKRCKSCHMGIRKHVTLFAFNPSTGKQRLWVWCDGKK